MDGWLTIKTKLDTKDFTKEIDALQYKIDDLEASLNMDNSEELFSTRELKEMESELEKAKNKMAELKKKQNELNSPTSGGGFSKMNRDLKEVVKSATRAALAVFGIRSAYLAVRSAASTLSQYNTQLASDLEYIRYAIARSLEPLITRLVDLAYQLLNAINKISVAWFGVNLFANASVASMKKASESAEKMKKSLAGFDEINMLSDNKNNSSIGGGAPSMDLSKMEGKTPEWLQFIIDNGEYLLAIIGGLIAGLEAFKLGLTGLQALGLGVAVAGLIYLIESVLAYLKDPSWENFGKILEGIGTILLGVSIAFGNWPVAIAGAIVLVSGLLAEHLEEVNKFFDTIIGALDKAIKWIHENLTTNFGIFGALVGSIIEVVLGLLRSAVSIIKEALNGVFTGVKLILDGIIQMFRGDFKGGLQTVWEGNKTIFTSALNIIKNALTTAWNSIKTVTTNVFNSVKSTITNIWNGIWNFLRNILNNIIGGFEKMVNGAIKGINKLLSGLRGLGNAVTKFIGLGEVFGTIPTVSLPRLASGGIVNVPNTGVVMGNAIVGEAGAEGVLPLTNEQTMSQLGAEIGKWITVNINMTNEIDGRVLNKRLQTIKNNNNFAMNR